MILTFDALVSDLFVNHSKLTVGNNQILTFYIDKTYGWNYLDRYTLSANGDTQYLDTLSTFNLGHNTNETNFIKDIFIKLDKIIDLDFLEMIHNNGSMLDIYHVNYSSLFETNVIGQAIPQSTKEGYWWDIFWKDSPTKSIINSDENLNTIIHEIGHTLGLSHPYDDPSNKSWNSEDTIMSYNEGPDGWDTWFSQNDLNALISIWGREDDMGVISFENKRSEYKFQKGIDQNYFIKSIIGLENITRINTIEFSDQSINVKEDIINVFDLIQEVDDITGKIYRLYNAAFGRFPDASGLKYWIDKNTNGNDTYRDTAKSFLISEEFQNLYGINPSNASYITSLYKNVLSRSPDTVGFDYWLNQLNNNYEDKSELLMGFSESSENKSIFSIETSIF